MCLCSHAMVHCNVCDATSDQVEEGAVRSNVRKFGATQFRIWRCPKCLSIHATDDADLPACYRDYPYHKVGKQDMTRWLVNAGYRNLLGRLQKAGLTRGSTLLDYGCGGGEFVRFLRDRGYQAEGFDEYSASFGDRRVLAAKYDVVLSQDVIEHVAEPWALVRTLADLIAPGGVLALGTPNAESVDMKNPGVAHHMLHQPYHRHILSKRAILSIGERFGWELERFYNTMYAHTKTPFMNGHFFAYYCKTGDDTLDYVVEPLRLGLPQLYKPQALYWALFGGVVAVPEDNVMAIFRTRTASAAQAAQ